MTIPWFQGAPGTMTNSSDNNNNNNNNNSNKINDATIQTSDSKQTAPKMIPIFEAVKVLVPAGPKSRHQYLDQKEQSRFSQLLLEHGEKHLQDWAVIAYSSKAASSNSSSSNSNNQSNARHQHQQCKEPTKTQWEQSPLKARPPRPATQHPSKLSSSSSDISSYASNNTLNNTPRESNNSHDDGCYPSTHMAKIEGRLHLCSRSIVFEPNDASRGIVRCPFRKLDGPPREYPPTDHSLPAAERFESMCVEFSAQSHVVCREHAAPAPFTHVARAVEFRFTFLHSSPQSFCELANQLWAIWKKHQHSGSRMAHELPELEALLKPMLERPFHPQHLVDVRERILTPTSLYGSLVTPLQRKQGCVVATTDRIYFQPATGALTATSTKAWSWPIHKVVATACRYNGLRDCAVEFYFQDSSSVLLAFERKRDREQLLRCLPRHLWSFTDREIVVAVAKAWCQNQVSNFEYLLALNAASGRSFHDLSRYPVVPWVLKDYTSSKLNWDNPEQIFRDLTKPVGALNPDRLNYFKTRLEGMQDMEDTFLYGTHYSTPGYVLYFLVRSMPEQMLCLQNGKFDSPDRMFYSLNHCFNCVLSNHADVKELIPEFYNAKDYDFLINARGLQLGATQTGDRVDDVMLPPWAKSPRDFLKKNRKALESDYCTKMLPKWIDLIFGVKSRGEAAKEADNLFHSCCYLGDIDLAAMKTEQERFQAELQATEFGLVPDQLFSQEHPGQLSPENAYFDEKLVSSEFGVARSLAIDAGGKGDAWELLDPPSATNSNNDEQSLSNQPSSSSALQNADAALPSRNPFENVGSSSPKPTGTGSTPFGSQQEPQSSHSMFRNIPLSGVGDVSGTDAGVQGRGAFSTLTSPSEAGNFGVPKIQGAASYDSTDSVTPRHHYPAESIAQNTEWNMKIIEKRHIHGDAVSGCALVLDDKMQLAVTTSLDGGLMAHTVTLAPQAAEDPNRRGLTVSLSRFSYISMGRGQTNEEPKLTEFRRHSARDPLACLVVTSDGAGGIVSFAGGHDDVVLAYGINSSCAVASVYSHRDAVTGLDLIPRFSAGNDSALWLENATHIMVSGSWDATVKVWSVTVDKGETVSVNREPLAELYDADSSIVCVSAVSVHRLEPNGGLVIAAGCADGSFCVWNLHSDGVTTVIHNEPAKRGSGPCSVLKWSTEEGKINLFTGFSTGKVASFTLEGGMLKRQSAVSFGVAVTCLVYSEGILLIGCADGGLRLIPVRNGTDFESKPSLWPGICGKSSPGISSINVTYTTLDGAMKCIACAGGEDGSFVLFELNQESQKSGGFM